MVFFSPGGNCFLRESSKITFMLSEEFLQEIIAFIQKLLTYALTVNTVQ